MSRTLPTHRPSAATHNIRSAPMQPLTARRERAPGSAPAVAVAAHSSPTVTVVRRMRSAVALWLCCMSCSLAVAAAAAACDSGWQYLSWQSRCYALSTSAATYRNASAACRSSGGSLLALKTLANLTTAMSLFGSGGGAPATVVSLLEYVTFANGTTLDSSGLAVADCVACANVSLAPGRVQPACLLVVLPSGRASAVVQDSDCSQPHTYLCGKAPTNDTTTATALDFEGKMAILCLVFILVMFAAVNGYFLLRDFLKQHPCRNKVAANEHTDASTSRAQLNKDGKSATGTQTQMTQLRKPMTDPRQQFTDRRQPEVQRQQPQVPQPQQSAAGHVAMEASGMPRKDHSQQSVIGRQQQRLPPSPTRRADSEAGQAAAATRADAAVDMTFGDGTRHSQLPNAGNCSNLDDDSAMQTRAEVTAAACEADMLSSRSDSLHYQPSHELPAALPPSRPASSNRDAASDGVGCDAEGQSGVTAPTEASVDVYWRTQQNSQGYHAESDLTPLIEALVDFSENGTDVTFSRVATPIYRPGGDPEAAPPWLASPPSRRASASASSSGGGGEGAEEEHRTAIYMDGGSGSGQQPDADTRGQLRGDVAPVPTAGTFSAAASAADLSRLGAPSPLATLSGEAQAGWSPLPLSRSPSSSVYRFGGDGVAIVIGETGSRTAASKDDATSVDGGGRQSQHSSEALDMAYSMEPLADASALVAAHAADAARIEPSRLSHSPHGYVAVAAAEPQSRLASARESRGGGGGGVSADADGRAAASTSSQQHGNQSETPRHFPSAGGQSAVELALPLSRPASTLSSRDSIGADAEGHAAASTPSQQPGHQSETPRHFPSAGGQSAVALALPLSRPASTLSSRGGVGAEAEDRAAASTPSQSETPRHIPSAGDQSAVALGLPLSRPASALSSRDSIGAEAEGHAAASTPSQQPGHQSKIPRRISSAGGQSVVALALPLSRPASTLSSRGGVGAEAEVRAAASTPSQQHGHETPPWTPPMAVELPVARAADTATPDAQPEW